jgi:hypothetical protein
MPEPPLPLATGILRLFGTPLIFRWHNGKMPKDIAPLIFEASTREKQSAKQALHNKAWISMALE